SAQQLKSLGKSHQFGGSGSATQNATTPAPQTNTGSASDSSTAAGQSAAKPNKNQLNPALRLNRVSRTDTSDTLSAGTGVNRTPTESGDLHRVVADVTYVVTVRAGSRTLGNGIRGVGTIDPVTFAVDVPDGLQFLMTQGQLDRDARWMGSVAGLTPAPVQGRAPLPAAYVSHRQLGLGGVLSVTEYARVPAPAPAAGGQIPLAQMNEVERRGQVGRELMTLVETEAPGVFTPGHSGYQQGVHSRIAQLTSTAGLRSLPGRGPDGTPHPATTRFHFRHHGYGGERLVEVTLRARPRRAQNLAGIRGTSTPGSGLEQWQSHTAAGRTTTRASVRQTQLPVTPAVRYLRPDQGADPLTTDRATPGITPQSASSISVRRATTADNRFWLRTDNGADFDGLRYDYELSVRSALVVDWPPNVIGGLIQHGVIAWADADGDVRQWIDRLLAGGNSRTSTVPVALALRFTGTETNTPVPTTTVPAASAESGADPRNTVRPSGPYLTDAQMFHPVGPTPAFHFDGWAHLETALNNVAPRRLGGWHAQITSVSVEGQAVRLGQLIQAGRVSLDRPRLVADLTGTMPGTQPFEGAPDQAPSIAVTLYNPRRSTHADDVTLDQLHNTTDTVSTAAGADHSLAVSYTQSLSGADNNRQIGGINVPVAQRQTQPSTFGGTTTGSRRDWLKSGSTAAPANGARGTRSYVVDADAHLLVEGPEGTRHVTGTVTLRVEERDLLGHGLLTPAESPANIHDVPALVPDWATVEPHTLPERLNSAIPPGSHGIQLWVALGADPQGEHLGQALYGASRAAVLGNRPLELMTRDPQGIRRWEFTPEGALVTADPDLTTAWDAFDAQAELLHTATNTLTDTPHQLNLLTVARREANQAYTAVAETHQQARLAVTNATTAHKQATKTAAGSARAAREAEARIERLKQELAAAQQTTRKLPQVIENHEREEREGQHDLVTALAALTRAENTVREERAAAARAAAEQAAKNGQSGTAPAPVPAPAPVTSGAPRPHTAAPDVAADPRVQAALPAITAAENAIQQATDALTAARPALAEARATVAGRPDEIRTAQQDHKKAVEKARADAGAAVDAADDLQAATQDETDAQDRVTEAAAEVARHDTAIVAAVTAQLQAAADQMAATAALPGLAADVQDSAPTPEQSLRTTFAATPPRWPAPDGRAAPLPAGGQTHTPAPATTTGTTGTNPTTTTTTPKPAKQQPKKSGPPKSGTSSAKTDKSKKPATGKSTGVDKGNGKSKAKSPLVQSPPPLGTTPAGPLSPYVAPAGNAVETPGDGNCLLYAVIGSAPLLVRTRLRQADPTFAPGTAAWLARPGDVWQTLTTLTGQPQTTNRGTGHLRAAQRGLQNLVLARLAAARDGSRPLPPQVLGQLRGVLAGRFERRVQNASDGDVDNELVRYGIQGVTHAEDLDPVDLQTRYAQAISQPNTPPAPAGAAPSNRRMFAYLRSANALPTLATMTADERRSLLTAGYHRSTAALTAYEARELDNAVRNWSNQWANPIGDTFLPLLADTLDAPIHVFQPVTNTPTGPRGIVLRYGPTTSNTPALEVHYTGLNHYSASDANTGTAPANITTSKAPRGPEDANSVLPKGRYRPAPTRDADEDRPASRVADPAPKDSWHGLRPHARPAVHSTERFDPHADQSNSPRPGALSGATTLVRTQVRRIQAPNGQWVRDYTLNLPVTTTSPNLTQQLNERITRLLDTHLNSGLALPGSGDQLHINLNLISDPAHPEAITLTNTANPDRADQLHLDANHSDEDLLHEVLHYLGLPDEQRDNDFLLRNHPNSTAVRTTGVMATTQTPVHIPHRYLRTIENVTAAGPRLHDHAGQDETTPVRDPDTTPISTDSSLTWPTSQAPTAQPPAQSQLPSSYVNSYGALPDGTVGLVYAEPFSDEVVEGLHGQVYEALGLDADNPPESVREQVRDALSRENLALQLPYLRSNGGHRITVRVGGRDRTVDVQLTLSDARASLRQGRFDPRDPDKHVERRGFGTRENFSSQPSGTYRTFQVPWTGSWPITAPTAVRAIDGSLTAAVTHNQAGDATTVTQAVQTTSSQRSNEPSDPVEFSTRWRVRVDAPAVTAPTTTTAPAPDGWGTAESHGPTTIWFPRHLTTADPAPGSLPAPAAVADLPLYGVDSVIDPRALYEHVHRTYHADLDDTAAGQVSDFLSEQVLRGTLPMQVDGGLYSPVITDADGNAVGMLHLVTTPAVGTPLRQSTPGQINLESHVVNTAKVDLSSKYTSGIGISGSGAAALTGDHSQGHPDASGTIGGSLGLRGQTQATVTNTYSASSSAGTMHAIRTNRGHLLTPSGVTYQVTLIRPDGTETRAPALTRAHGMDLRVLSKADATGHPPTAAETRELPDSLERLDGIGLSAAPLDVTGTDGLFDEAEAWLRREGFLPPSPTAPAPTGVGARLKQALRNHEPEHQIRLHAQLNNLRRLREARSRTGLRAATDAMVDGGHSLHFEVPNSSDTGVRRVRLLLTADRDTGQASTHHLVLPGIQVMGLAQMAGSDAEQRGESYGGALGPMASVSGPLGSWGSIGFGADYQYGHQVTHGDTVGGATSHDQFYIGTGQDSHAFDVPVRLALDLYADDGDQPSVRFGQNVNQALAPAAPVVAPVPTAVGVPPVASAPPVAPTVTGSLRLAVPNGRTHAPATTPAPPARTDGAPRRPNAVDRARLDGTDATGTPRPELVRIPDDALIDTVRGSAAVESAFQRAAAEIRNLAQPTPPAATGTGTGPILPVTAPATTGTAPATTGTAPAPAARDGISPLAGHGLMDGRTRAAETRHAAITPGSLVA
ncbi:hypothetical protein ACWDEW_48650, partial [Streptomyces sp. NPDC001100]